MITHNMDIAKCADRILRLNDGKIVGEENIWDYLQNYL